MDKLEIFTPSSIASILNLIGVKDGELKTISNILENPMLLNFLNQGGIGNLYKERAFLKIMTRDSQEIITDNKIKDLFSNFDVVSLGYNCTPKFFKNVIETNNFLKSASESSLFDWMGINMSIITHLLLHDFNDLLNIAYFKNLNTVEPVDHFNNTIINDKYFIRFPHDIDIIKNNWDNFTNKYMRRIKRFYHHLKCINKSIYLYLEETESINLDASYKWLNEKYPKCYCNNRDIFYKKLADLEQKKIQEFVQILKIKFNKYNFVILYFSKYLENQIRYENNVLYIRLDQHKKYEWHNIYNSIKNPILQNIESINTVLKNIPDSSKIILNPPVVNVTISEKKIIG